MAITFIGNGTTTSSVAITAPDLTNQFVALPEQQVMQGRDLTYETEAGFVHSYRRGQPRRLFQMGVRLLTASQLRSLMGFYEDVTDRHWFTWSMHDGIAEAGTGTTLDDTVLEFNFTGEHVDRVLFMIGGTGAGQIRRITASASQSGGTRLTFATVTTPPDSTTQFAIGWPVRIVGGISRQAYGNNLYSADFMLEEVILPETV